MAVPVTAPIRVCLVGLGAIGREVLRALVARAHLKLVAAVDPACAGRDAGEVAGIDRVGVTVLSDVGAGLAAGADLALVMTGSGTAEMMPIIEAAAVAGVDVISSCEDLAYPRLSTPELADVIDARARAGDITVLGTGVNPGFVMDRLPLQLAGACVSVDAVRVERVVDAAKRRGPLRAKVGADLSPEEFRAGVSAQRLGHRGLPESCALLATGLGFSLEKIRATIDPVITSEAEPRQGIKPGRVAGLRQVAVGLRGGREVLRLELEMSVAAPSPHDQIWIDGDPPLNVRIDGGTHGDRGTVATILNAIPAVLASAPGLKTVLDLPLYAAR